MNIVTGNPRSGTSLLMDCFVQSLGEDKIVGAKFPNNDRRLRFLFHDSEAIRIARLLKKESSNIANPLGFWEGTHTGHGITEDNNPDCWAKVVFGGLMISDPKCLGKVIVAMREPSQQASSFSSTLDHWYSRTLNGMNWLQENKLDCLVVDYGDMVSDPATQLARISVFTGLDISKHQVTPDLYRHRVESVPHLATDLYQSIIAGSFRSEDFEVLESPQPQKRKGRRSIDDASRIKRSANLKVCYNCPSRIDSLCPSGVQVLKVVDESCPESRWKV